MRPATYAGDAAKTSYDVEGRVKTVTVGGTTVESVYDDAGQRIARTVSSGSTVTERSFYFGRTVEIRNGELIRHFHANGRRIAFSPVNAPSYLTLAAAADPNPSVMLARHLPLPQGKDRGEGIEHFASTSMGGRRRATPPTSSTPTTSARPRC